MDGDSLSAEKVLEVSKWPSRLEQISLLVGQILGPGSQLSAQLKGPGSQLAGQVKKLVEDKEARNSLTLLLVKFTKPSFYKYFRFHFRLKGDM